MNYVLPIELAVSTLASGAISSTFNFEPLVTALITFGVSLVTLVGGELIKYLVNFFKKKTQDLNLKEDKDEDKKEK